MVHILEIHQRHYNIWRLLCDSSIDKLLCRFSYLLQTAMEFNKSATYIIIIMYFNDISITKVVSHGSQGLAHGMHA